MVQKVANIWQFKIIKLGCVFEVVLVIRKLIIEVFVSDFMD